jgi:hypothetical protein
LGSTARNKVNHTVSIDTTAKIVYKTLPRSQPFLR